VRVLFSEVIRGVVRALVRVNGAREKTKFRPGRRRSQPLLRIDSMLVQSSVVSKRQRRLILLRSFLRDSSDTMR